MKTSEMTLPEAREIRDLKISVMARRFPLRRTPVIVHGPSEEYLVVTLGYAATNELPIVK